MKRLEGTSDVRLITPALAGLLGFAGAVLLAAWLLHLSEWARTTLGAAGLAAVVAACILIQIRARVLLRESRRRELFSSSAALQDPLTGLPNRAAFHAFLNEALSGADRGSGKEIAVLYADLDHFKEVNDSLGHSAGDELLEEVSTRFKEVLRKDDLLARIGGDEFALILQDDDVKSRAEQVAERMIEAVRRPLTAKDDVIFIGVSVGIAIGEAGEFSSEELLRRADVALYRAKGESRLCYRCFEPFMDEAGRLKRALRSDLERALEQNELRVVLQPIFDARSGRIASAEALLRWAHPERGDVPPSQFIPVAEEAGQIVEISAFALRGALEAARELASIPIAVNISPVQFRSRGFAHLVADSLLSAGVSPDLLKIEITEGVLIKHTEAARATLRQLREMGVQVILDDFGTGFSSLSYLQNFAFDGMKIDRSFLRHLGARSQSTQLMRAIIDLGHSLHMEVVAEGIENAWQTSVLQLLGCDYLQGFYLGLPGDLAAIQACGSIDIQTAISAPVGGEMLAQLVQNHKP
ncbi:MAG TPA: EAL domain-containing protein [Allosphingosinicella sp.]|uniref:putative bifunctional diguanylate cyclase/phosphodiesterase n=1 Tax=Allosphingosinicella sp. TaxID=2823234 RepID=UPI002EDA5A14